MFVLSVRIDYPRVVVGLVRAPGSVDKGDLLAVGRPLHRRDIPGKGVVGEPANGAASGGSKAEVAVEAGEGNLLAVGRPGKGATCIPAVGHAAEHTAVGGNQVQRLAAVERAFAPALVERDPASVGRPAGVGAAASWREKLVSCP